MAKLHTQDEAASLHIHWTLCFNWHCLFVMFKYYRNRTNHTSHHCSCNNDDDDDERQTCKQPSQSIWTRMKNYFTAVQCRKSLWFHGTHLARGQNKFLWEESRRISEGRCDEQQGKWSPRFHTRWRLLTLATISTKETL